MGIGWDELVEARIEDSLNWVQAGIRGEGPG
jgi:hypothetical protein